MLNADSEPRAKLQMDMMPIFILMNCVFEEQRIFLNIVREVMAAVLVGVVTGIAA